MKHPANEGRDVGAAGPLIFTPTPLSPPRIGLLLGRAGGETEAQRGTGGGIGRGGVPSPQRRGMGPGVLDHGVDSTGN